MTSPTLWWTSSSAACHEICSNCPEPFTPPRRSGCSRRCGPCTKAVISRATLEQITPSVNGIASEPRTFVMRPPSTVTVRLQVSGQSKVQTLGCSSRDIGGSVPKRDDRLSMCLDLAATTSSSGGVSLPLNRDAAAPYADGENASRLGRHVECLRFRRGNEDRFLPGGERPVLVRSGDLRGDVRRWARSAEKQQSMPKGKFRRCRPDL